MLSMSRRTPDLNAVVAAATLGLDRSIAISAPELGRRTSDPGRGFVGAKVGDAACTALYHGIWEKAHDRGFFSNATVGEPRRALASAGYAVTVSPA
jgi:hypothetical protein